MGLRSSVDIGVEKNIVPSGNQTPAIQPVAMLTELLVLVVTGVPAALAVELAVVVLVLVKGGNNKIPKKFRFYLLWN